MRYVFQISPHEFAITVKAIAYQNEYINVNIWSELQPAWRSEPSDQSDSNSVALWYTSIEGIIWRKKKIGDNGLLEPSCIFIPHVIT